MDPKDLPLRDIHLPEQVSWWPLATGWWVSLMLLVLSTLLLAWWWRGAATRRVRRAALSELSVLETAYARDGDGHACAQGLSRLLRRLALLAGDQGAAHSSGEALLSVLAPMQQMPLAMEVIDLLRHAPYSPAAAAAIDAERYRNATASLRVWLTRLRIPSPNRARSSHAAV